MGILSFANTIHNVLFKMLHWLPASKRIDFRISIGLRLTFPLRKNPQPTCGSFVAMHEIELPGENNVRSASQGEYPIVRTSMTQPFQWLCQPHCSISPELGWEPL